MSPEAIVMMIVSLVTIWGGLALVSFNLWKRGTDRDQ